MEPSTLFYSGTYSQKRISKKLVSGHILTASDLLCPISLKDEEQSYGVETMPGVDCLTIPHLINSAFAARVLGIDTIALFQPAGGSEQAWDEDHLMRRAVRSLKSQVPGITVICDAAFVHEALALANAGCDIIAPSDRNKIRAVRHALDKQGFEQVRIMSNVRAADSDAALREVDLDVAEGADIIIIKPGLSCLHILGRVKETSGVPSYAWQVSIDDDAILQELRRRWHHDVLRDGGGQAVESRVEQKAEWRGQFPSFCTSLIWSLADRTAKL